MRFKGMFRGLHCHAVQKPVPLLWVLCASARALAKLVYCKRSEYQQVRNSE